MQWRWMSRSLMKLLCVIRREGKKCMSVRSSNVKWQAKAVEMWNVLMMMYLQDVLNIWWWRLPTTQWIVRSFERRFSNELAQDESNDIHWAVEAEEVAVSGTRLPTFFFLCSLETFSYKVIFSYRGTIISCPSLLSTLGEVNCSICLCESCRVNHWPRSNIIDWMCNVNCTSSTALVVAADDWRSTLWRWKKCTRAKYTVDGPPVKWKYLSWRNSFKSHEGRREGGEKKLQWNDIEWKERWVRVREKKRQFRWINWFFLRLSLTVFTSARASTHQDSWRVELCEQLSLSLSRHSRYISSATHDHNWASATVTGSCVFFLFFSSRIPTCGVGRASEAQNNEPPHLLFQGWKDALSSPLWPVHSGHETLSVSRKKKRRRREGRGREKKDTRISGAKYTQDNSVSWEKRNLSLQEDTSSIAR